ncbi:MAG: pyridoxamine 5'-phosphate oxidase family protein [Thermoleophilia bacterium]|nr:pyridoxamine 5'-phosphate oxidase family protein [Thermoleophilia bacterium]
MDAREIAAELQHPGARTLLASATLLRLAYNGPDGAPRVVPMGFFWDGSRIVVCTAVTAPKVGAMSSRPDVAVTIDVGDTPAEARSVLLRGRARVDVVDGVPDEFVTASAKALGAHRVPELERRARLTYRRMARISIEPAWARFYDFGAGRLPSFLTEPT